MYTQNKSSLPDYISTSNRQAAKVRWGPATVSCWDPRLCSVMEGPVDQYGQFVLGVSLCLSAACQINYIVVWSKSSHEISNEVLRWATNSEASKLTTFCSDNDAYNTTAGYLTSTTGFGRELEHLSVQTERWNSELSCGLVQEVRLALSQYQQNSLARLLR
jgi:hypothetical protein